MSFWGGQVSIHVSHGLSVSSPGGCCPIFLPKWHLVHGRSQCFVVALGAGALVWPLSCGSLLGSAQGYRSVPSLEVSMCFRSHLIPWEISMICAVEVWGSISTSSWQLSCSLKSHEDPQPLWCDHRPPSSSVPCLRICSLGRFLHTVLEHARV